MTMESGREIAGGGGERPPLIGWGFKWSMIIFAIVVVALATGLANFANEVISVGEAGRFADGVGEAAGDIRRGDVYPITRFLLLLGSCAFAAAAFFLIIGLARWIIAFISAATSIDARPLDALIALAVVAVSFPTLASGAFALLRDVFSLVSNNLFQEISFAISSGATACERCIAQQFEQMTQPAINIVQYVSGSVSFREFPGVQFIVAAALWSLLVWLIASAQRDGSWWKGMSGARKRTAAYVILTMFSSYLGISALLAFALFDGDREERIAEADFETDVTELEDVLKKIAGEIPAVAAENPAQTNKVKGVETAANDTRPPEERETRSPPPDADAGSRNDTPGASLPKLALSAEDQAFLVNIAARADASRQKAMREARTLRELIKLEFRNANQNRLGRREINDHATQLTKWYATQMREIEGETNRCIVAVSAANLRFIAVAAEPDSPQFDVAFLREDARIRAQNSVDNACGYNTFFGNFKDIPKRTAYGASLGPVAEWTSWLLTSESAQLSLIIGLIGFGLLGATASNYFQPEYAEAAESNWTGKDRKAESESAPADAKSAFEVSSVFVKGFVAAIVVYLSATGGLAIVGDGGSTPNPYIVFAACLVGAVFSEDVWRWARKKLTPNAGQ